MDRKEAQKKAESDSDFRDQIEKAAHDPEYQKYLDEVSAKEQALKNHPYTRTKDILDAEYELVISYPKNGVPVGNIIEADASSPEGMPIIESILAEENPGALITNDLEIIELTPDVDMFVFAEETKVNAVWKGDDVKTKDYTIYEYKRIK